MVKKNSFIFITLIIAILFTILLSSSIMAYPQRVEPSFGGCYISTGHGLLDDLDCDKVPDFVDNCVLVPNPDQMDQTMNGLGDSCDLVIDDIKVEPGIALQGRSMITTIKLTNYREYDMRNLVVKAESNTLGIGDHVIIDVASLATKEAEVIMRVPDCAAPGEYDLFVTIEYPYTSGKKEVFIRGVKIKVQESGLCAPLATQTIIDINEIQDVHPIEGAYYPFVIKNNEMFSKAYTLSIEGIEAWGNAQIEPGTRIIVPAGETREGAIHVLANEGVTGKQSFFLIIASDDDAKQVPLLADIPDPIISPNKITFFNWLTTTLIVIAIIIIIVLVIQKKK